MMKAMTKRAIETHGNMGMKGKEPQSQTIIMNV
jgi:hypothetical protein